jgi:DNA modification methylase
MNIITDLSIGKYFTFDPSKDKPIYNWLYYKEAFSPEVVDYVIEKYAGGNVHAVYDPFCGAGTAMLRAKELGISGFAVDSSPLAVFVSKVKCAEYSQEDINEVKKFMEKSFEPKPAKFSDWKFELFPPALAFPKSNLNTLVALRSEIENVENQNSANLLMLALLSAIPQCSLVVKDGGVLKISKKKSAMPVKETFRRKIKSMLADIRPSTQPKTAPDIRLGDARQTDFESSSADLIVTSPPYLNNIDYSKIYGLELSFLAMDKRITSETRSRSIRSFITSTSFDRNLLTPEVQEFADKIPIVGSYFSDIFMVVKEMHRILRPGGVAGFVVGNAVIHETHILVDEIIAEMAEAIGFECEIIVGLERIADVKPAKVKTRESLIVMKKQ